MSRKWSVTLVTLALAAAVGGWARPPVVSAADAPFTDIAGTTFEADIEWLWAEGITVGCGPTLYCPNAFVTRGQMASFLVRLFDLTEGAHKDAFDDDDGSMHEEDINRLAYAGLTTGCRPNAFCPNEPVRRDAMASFLVRAIGLTEGDGRNYFRDDDESSHEVDIDRAAAAGIASGCYPYLYCPARWVTRDQMAGFLHRVDTPLTSELPHPAPMGAQTLYVETDGRDAANSCLEVGNPCRTIRHGIEASLGGDAIILGAGTFREGGLRLEHDITVTGDPSDATVIDASGGPDQRVVTIDGAEVALRHLILTGGVGDGAAIDVNGRLTLSAATITANHAPRSGGAIHAQGNDTILIEESTIDGNSAGAHGGALDTMYADVTLVRSTVSRNTAPDGGGLYVHYGKLTLVDSTVSGNSGLRHGGGIFNRYGRVTIVNSTVSGNVGGGSGAGGVEMATGDLSVLVLANALIAGNTTPNTPDVLGPITSKLASIVGIPAGLTLADILDPAGLADNGGPTQTIALTDSATNPAIDHGDAATCAAAPVDGVDQRGTPRTPPCDIGAYELQQ